MIELLGTVLATSLVGSVHCAAMCGPFVALYAGDRGAGVRGPGDRGAAPASRRLGRRLAPHLAYSAGRLAVYAGLGAGAGALGAAVDRAGDLIRIQRAAAIVGSAWILGFGVISLLAAIGVRIPGRRRGDRPSPVLLVAVRRRRPAVRAALVGLFSAALPCGWLYAFVVAAGATGSPGRGALLMATFWLGTLPMLLGLGLVLRRLVRLLGRRMPIVTAAALLAVGIAGLLVRAPMLGATPRIAHAAAGDISIPTTPPCHAH